MNKLSPDVINSIVTSELAQIERGPAGGASNIYRTVYNMTREQGLGNNPNTENIEPTIRFAHSKAIESAHLVDPDFDVAPPTRTIGPWRLARLRDSIDFNGVDTFDGVITSDAECLHSRLYELFSKNYVAVPQTLVTSADGTSRQPRGFLDESSDWVYEPGQCRLFEVVDGDPIRAVTSLVSFSIERVGESEHGKYQYDWLVRSENEDVLHLAINSLDPAR